MDAPTAPADEAFRAAEKARDRKALAEYYAPGVEAWYADHAQRRGDAVIIPGNHDHNFRLLSFLDEFQPPAGEFQHLDVGCGAGLYAVSVLLRHPGARITGVDISGRNLAAADALARKFGVRDRIRLLRADANQMPIRGRFDTILCSEIVEHLPDPRPLLDQLKALSHERTQLVVSVPHIDVKNAAGDIMYVRADARGNKLAESADVRKVAGAGDLQAYYHHLFTEAEIVGLLRDRGFEPRQRGGANFRFPPRLPVISFALKSVFRSAAFDAWLNRVTRRRFAGNLLVIAEPRPR